MKLAVLAASALIGVAFASPSFANDVMQEMSRLPTSGVESGMAARVPVHAFAPQIESVRPHSGMLPLPSGPVRSTNGSASTQTPQGADIRPSLARE